VCPVPDHGLLEENVERSVINCDGVITVVDDNVVDYNVAAW